MKKFLLIIPLISIFLVSSLFASQFEELDKPPEGAHEGQMFLGGFISIGFPYGDLITSEENFLQNNTYKFGDSEITKELLVTHLSYDFGLSFEYMPIDYIGIKTKLKRTIVVQRTLFGSDFENWSKTLYSNFAFLVGPAFHLTCRKQWDVTLTPVIGYTLAKYEATPIAAELIQGYKEYNGKRKRDVNGFAYGAELNLTIYFSGGLFISLGADWNNYPLKFSPALTLVNYSTETGQGTGAKINKTSGTLQTINLVLSVGYAFSN